MNTLTQRASAPLTGGLRRLLGARPLTAEHAVVSDQALGDVLGRLLDALEQAAVMGVLPELGGDRLAIALGLVVARRHANELLPHLGGLGFDDGLQPHRGRVF